MQYTKNNPESVDFFGIKIRFKTIRNRIRNNSKYIRFHFEIQQNIHTFAPKQNRITSD